MKSHIKRMSVAAPIDDGCEKQRAGVHVAVVEVSSGWHKADGLSTGSVNTDGEWPAVLGQALTRGGT